MLAAACLCPCFPLTQLVERVVRARHVAGKRRGPQTHTSRTGGVCVRQFARSGACLTLGIVLGVLYAGFALFAVYALLCTGGRIMFYNSSPEYSRYYSCAHARAACASSARAPLSHALGVHESAQISISW